MRAFVAAAVLTSAVALHAGVYKQQEDFAVFRLAGARALAAEPLYRADEASPFKYAPAVALALSPFAAVPERLGAWVWLLLSVVALLWFMWTVEPDGRHFVVALWCLPFSKALFSLGQCDALLLAGMLLSERATKRPWVSGALWALICAVKPAYLVFLPLALVGKQWQRVAALAGAGLLLLAVPALRWGWSGNLEQLQAGASLVLGAKAMLCSSENQSLAAMLCSLGLDVRIGLTVLGLAALALVGWLRLPALAFYGTALLSPHGWRFTLLGLIPLFYAVARDRKAWAWAAPSIAAVLGLIGWELFGAEGWRTLGNLRVFGLLGLVTAVTAVLLLKAPARPRAA